MDTYTPVYVGGESGYFTILTPSGELPGYRIPAMPDDGDYTEKSRETVERCRGLYKTRNQWVLNEIVAKIVAWNDSGPDVLPGFATLCDIEDLLQDEGYDTGEGGEDEDEV